MRRPPVPLVRAQATARVPCSHDGQPRGRCGRLPPPLASTALRAVAMMAGWPINCRRAPLWWCLVLGDLHRLPGSIVEVFCRCDQRIAARRYALRAGTRAAGHFAAERTIGELWNDEVAQPVAGGWPVIEISTNSPVDVGPLTVRIRTAASAIQRE